MTEPEQNGRERRRAEGIASYPLPLNRNAPASVLEAAFWKFHDENPAIYEFFKRFAQIAIDHGAKAMAGRFIGERIRWEIMITTTTTDKDYKISNNHIPYYVRLYVFEFPSHLKHFEFRPVVGEKLKALDADDDNDDNDDNDEAA